MKFEEVIIHTNLWISRQLHILEIQGANSRLTFGTDVVAIVNQPITVLADEADAKNQFQLGIIVDAIHRVFEEKRNIFFTYTSYLPDDQCAFVSVNAIYLDSDTLYLEATEINRDDLRQAYAQDMSQQENQRQKQENLYNPTMTILNSLPVGVEVYGPEGNLLFLNDTECRILNIDRKTLMDARINIQDNPNLPEEMKKAAMEGKEICTQITYSFDNISKNQYYPTSQTRTIQLECTGRPVINSSGKIENTVFIVEDVTEASRQEEKKRQNRLKMDLAMKVANIMLWEFDIRTQQFFSENDPLNNFNPDQPISIQEYIEIIHPEDHERSYSYIQKMLDGKDEVFDFDLRFMFPGKPKWQHCTLSGSPFERDANNKIIKYVGFRKNITELQNQKILQETILNSIPLPIHIKDVEDNYRYVFCNKLSQRMFGSNVGQTIYDVWDESLVSEFKESDLAVFNSDKPYFGKAQVVLKDGRTYDTIVRKSVIEDSGKRLLLSVYWDQSVQNELEMRSKVLSFSMNALNAYTWEYDVTMDRFRYGEGFEKICPNLSSMDTAEKFALHVHPENRELFHKALSILQNQDKEDFTFEYRVDLTGKDNYEWWECRGVLETKLFNNIPHKYIYGMDINIQAHKKTEFALLSNKEELSRSIRQNELVLNNTNSGLAFITPDYIVQWENVSMGTTNFEYEAYKKGEPCYQSAHNRTEPCENCVLQQVMKSKKTERIKFKLENKRTIEVYSTPVLNDDESVDGIVIRIDDITEREQFDELVQAKVLAEQSDKLKSAFLANMSHEIRTPLNAIIGFSNLLIVSTDPEEKEEFIRIIENNNELLLKVINDILDLSKIEAGTVELKYEDFNLSEYFKSMVTSMKQRETNPGVTLIARYPDTNFMVRLDKNRLAQILTNYVTNAIKYTPKGTIEMGFGQTEAGIRLYVRDTGIGIHESKRNRVFQRFEKLDEFAQGTGLGLSICKAIAESMGGTVGFESEYGLGSLFWADLPCEVALTVC